MEMRPLALHQTPSERRCHSSRQNYSKNMLPPRSCCSIKKSEPSNNTRVELPFQKKLLEIHLTCYAQGKLFLQTSSGGEIEFQSASNVQYKCRRLN